MKEIDLDLYLDLKEFISRTKHLLGSNYDIDNVEERLEEFHNKSKPGSDEEL